MNSFQKDDAVPPDSSPLPKVVYVLGTADWHKWIYPFLKSKRFTTTVVITGSSGPDFEPGIERIIKQTNLNLAARTEAVLLENPDAVVVLPHQDSLVQDTELGERLKTILGGQVITTSAKAARCGTEKIFMKETFRKLSIPTPFFATHEEPSFSIGEKFSYPAYIKRSADHEGKGNFLINSQQDLRHVVGAILNENLPAYLEELVEGEELSVIIAGLPGNICVLPPVYKGVAQPGADHPARRFRFCAPGDCHLNDAADLYKYGKTIIEFFNSGGLVEVEAIRHGAGFSVLEVNMRLAATLRMSMLASGINVLSWLGELAAGTCKGLPTPSAQHFVCEFPVKPQYDAITLRQIASLDFVTTTTRFTVNASSMEELTRNVRHIAALLGEADISAKVEEMV